MGVVSLQQNIDQEQAGEIRGLELIALKYTGSNSSIATRGTLATQARWPGTAPLNKGIWYFGLVPDEGLAYLENRDDFEMVFADDSEAFAKTLLSKHRLPENVFGRNANRDLQTRVFDAIGIENPMQAGPVEEQLHDIAGVDASEVEEDEPDNERVSALVSEYSRKQLKAAVEEVRADADEFSLRGSPGPTELAEFLAEQDESEVNDALQSGGDDE